MSTENTLTDVPASGASTESVSTSTGTDSVKEVQTSSPTAKGLDNLKKLAKEKAAPDKGDYKAKSVEESLAAEKTDAVLPTAEDGKPKYVPNYKYKVALQEKEIDEFWRPLIKDAESEAKVRDFFTKYDGFDHIKQSRDNIQKQFESLQNDYTAQNNVISRVETALQKKDLTSVFRQLGVTDQDIFGWTHQRLQMMELPPDQRKAWEESEQSRLQNFEMEEKFNQMQRLYEEQAVQARTMQLDMVLTRPEVVQAASGWDEVQGQQGAFRDLVIQEAQTAYFQTGVDLSAEQAVQRVMQKFGKVLSQNAGAQQSVSQAQTPVISATQTAPQVPNIPQSKPVIPSVNGKGASPIKKVPRSLDELKKIARELNT
jgi:hypothetical protein